MISLLSLVLANTAPKVHTFFFVTSDCPIAKRFAPEIKRIMKDYDSMSTFLFVYEDEGTTSKKIEGHHTEYKLTCPFTLDPNKHMALENHITGVPTVVVRSSKGALQYRGRIDDSYGSDFKWHPAKQKDLRNALAALRNGEAVKVKQTKVIGCALNP